MYEYTHVSESPVCIYIYIHFWWVTLSLFEPLRSKSMIITYIYIYMYV